MAEKKEQAARLDAQEKARQAESEKLRAQAEVKKNKRAREANDFFRDGVAYAQRAIMVTLTCYSKRLLKVTRIPW
jgi:hypothetical protein